MKIIKNRISAVLLSLYMVFGVVSTDYLQVQAFEWVVPSLTVGDSILWLMGLLGMTYTEGASAWRDVSPEYEQEFIDYANEHGLTYNETDTWLNNVSLGKLDQLSNVWNSFKEWVKSKFTSSSIDSFIVGSSYEDSLLFINSIFNTNLVVSNDNLSDIPIYSIFVNYSITNNSINYIYFYTQNNYDYSNLILDGGTYITSPSTISHISINYLNGEFVESGVGTQNFRVNKNAIGVSSSIYITSNLINSVLDGINYNLLEGIFNNEDIAVYDPVLIPDINFANSNTEDASIPGVIDLPWGNLGDDEEERDKTYDDLVGGLDLGKEIGDLWQALQDLMGVLAVDDAGVLQPNSGGENPPTLEDEAENNKLNGAFVLTGLQKVFPFCIPFDLYAFITLLEAPPVAPVIEYPIYNPVTKSNEIITIDFSTWESVVILFRYIFDFLFIIGLLLMARALIGGGDSA